ncbi:DEAD/DEAH box helicase family protein [Candidatus Albibeggiatoa sp. nov. NOAA]|uniref:DEAD/DEAH box helicase family protein n=1 Tax=Candidatus Albibeggiatoa sp. nov. NOAA TaxID=3162724 RepID=UPI0033005C84|nr:DEAD/DEAH box helicase family protein [Thiotrichaceae bacterium]
MSTNEATIRIKINKLLEAAGWRLLDDKNGQANIKVESNVKLPSSDKMKNGFIDYLLLDENGFPLAVLEAKALDIDPLAGKEQARKYAAANGCHIAILSNGNVHYLWDIKRGNPSLITQFPSQQALQHSSKDFKYHHPNSEALIQEQIDADYVVLTQMPNYKQVASWKNKQERADFINTNKLRFLRDYQQQAIKSIQTAVKQNESRFLLEMATGTGKTLTAAAILKLFLRTGNARRVLFLVDRLELEDQAQKDFTQYLKKDFQSVVYKKNRDDWRKAEIVVTTVQSLLRKDKYRDFSSNDFDLVISDEAHRSIGGKARKVFDYFVGYKLGLTATPKDYLKKFDLTATQSTPREYERRVLLDTYRTFGCDDGQPTFRYSLLDGVEAGYLINPIVVDARTEVTTQLLSEQGFIVEVTDEEGETQEQRYQHREFEKRFFSDMTNQVFCKTFLDNALRDPISGEIGKTIMFAVSQSHAARLTNILNEMAMQMFPNKYQSNFAMQVTSNVADAQSYTEQFANNKLSGVSHFLESYKTSKTRVCVTVGMMTTGYDCPDILNLCLVRPIFSPTDFIQIKGRGTRKHNFLDNLYDKQLKATVQQPEKTEFKLFDFFANCEYFEEQFNYDEVLKLPSPAKADRNIDTSSGTVIGAYKHTDSDVILTVKEEKVGYGGMKIDRMFFRQFEDTVKDNSTVRQYVQQAQWESAIHYVNQEIMNKPSAFFTVDKLRQAAEVDRRLDLREILEKIFGLISHFKSKDELLEDEFVKFVNAVALDASESMVVIKDYFKAYATDDQLREIIDQGHYAELHTNPTFSMRDFKAVPSDWRKRVPLYVQDHVSLEQFLS